MISNRLKTDPIPVVRQTRDLRVRDVTTMRPGLLTPIAFIPLLRMDSCSGRVQVGFNMAETYEELMNPVKVRVTAWFMPHIALERFERSRAIFERSFAGQPKTTDVGAPVVPYFETHAHPATAGSHHVYKALGISAKAGVLVNTGVQETYNQIANYMREQRSKSLPLVDLDNSDLLPALWLKNDFSDIVPDFDDAMIAGELPLTVTEAALPVSGIGFKGAVTGGSGGTYYQADGAAATYANGVNSSQADPNVIGVEMRTGGYPNVFANLSENGISVSLANVDQARALVEWAKLRESYEGHKDGWIIDLLMQGVEVEEQRWFQPMLLDQQEVTIRQAKRMAMDGASLEEGAANGAGVGSIGLNVPPNPYGGLIMIMAEALPEQLYERQADPYFTCTSVSQLPNYQKDVLNPMPVVEVLNKHVDVDHDTPDGLFGYARRNWQWARIPSRVGGDLFAPDADAATTVARRIIYPTDVENPELGEEFYLSTTLGMTPFLATDKDPIVVGLGGSVSITGLTIVGAVHESEANYSEVRADNPPLIPIK